MMRWAWLCLLAGCAHDPLFSVGRLDAQPLLDGEIDIDNDGQTFGLGHSTAEVGDLLASAGLSRTRTSISIQPLLVRTRDRVLLFDAGAGHTSWARGGKLPTSLARIGVAPSAITDVFVSHGHLDHTAGLVRGGELAFPHARIHMSAPEWAFMQANPETKAVAQAIASHVDPFEPGAQLLPEVRAIATPGHTPGHSSYEIGSGKQRLFYLGDVAHHVVVSVQRPDWPVDFDTDKPAAEAMRRATLARLARDHERVYAVHFPYPGFGYVIARGDAFVWAP